MVKKKDSVDLAVAKSASATNLFAKAKQEIDHSTDLLNKAEEAARSAIAELQSRVGFISSQKSSNKKVADRLAEFVV